MQVESNVTERVVGIIERQGPLSIHTLCKILGMRSTPFNRSIVLEKIDRNVGLYMFHDRVHLDNTGR